MNQFLLNALGLLKKYKLLLRKKLSQDEYQESLIKLQLHESLPRDEVTAYRSLTLVMNHLKKQADMKKVKNQRFSGTLRFLEDIENLLNWYRLEKNKVIHVSQEASNAMVMAIQLIVLPVEKRTKTVAVQLERHALKIAQHGLNEQKLVFLHSLKKVLEHDESFFGPLIDRYKEYLQKHTDSYLLMQLIDAA